MSVRGYGLTYQGGNSWRVQISLGKNYVTGRYQRHFETITAKSKTEAHRQAEVIRDRLKRGYSGDVSKVTVEEYLREYLDTTAALKAQPSTVKGYKGIAANYIYPRIGSIPLSQLNVKALDRFYADVAKAGRVGQRRKDGTRSKGGKPLSPATVKRIHEVLNMALNQAVRHEIIPSNPAQYATRPARQQVKRKALNSQEVAKLEALIADMEDRALAASLAIGLNTGARLGEVLGLQWRHVELEGIGRIRIEQTRKSKPSGGYEYGSTKSKKARAIDIDSELRTFLQRHKEQQRDYLASLGAVQTAHTPVVMDLDGTVSRNDTITNKTVKLFRKHGFSEGLSYHCLRHTHATLLLSEGVPIVMAKDRLGHADIKLTVDTYGHIVEGQGEAAALAWESAKAKARERAQALQSIES